MNCVVVCVGMTVYLIEMSDISVGGTQYEIRQDSCTLPQLKKLLKWLVNL